MTYTLTGYNTHPTKGHRTTIQKTLATNCKSTAAGVRDMWQDIGLDVSMTEMD